MALRLMGKQMKEFSFKDKETHEDVARKGITIHFTEEKNDVEGVACDSAYVDSSRTGYMTALRLNLGDEIVLLRDKYGKVDDILVTRTAQPAQ